MKKLAVLVIGLGCMLALAACISGCGEQDAAGTRVSYSIWTGFKMSDTRNNDIKFKGKINPMTNEFEVDEFTMVNNASDVNPTIAELVMANAAYQKQLGDNAIGVVDAVGNAAEKFMPMLIARDRAKADVKLGKIASQQAVTEAMSAVFNGGAAPRDVAEYLEPGEREIFNRRLAAMEADLKAMRESQPGSAGAGEGQTPGAGAGEAPGPQSKADRWLEDELVFWLRRIYGPQSPKEKKWPDDFPLTVAANTPKRL